MTERQKENINSLLEIEEYDTDLDMTIFHEYDTDLDYKIDNDDYPCGTAACLAGHLPLTTGIAKEKGESWPKYIMRVTGLKQLSREWKYLFSPVWPDDKTDALNRVQTFIDNGYKAPENY